MLLTFGNAYRDGSAKGRGNSEHVILGIQMMQCGMDHQKDMGGVRALKYT